MSVDGTNLVPDPPRVSTSLLVALGKVNLDFVLLNKLSAYFASCRNRSILRRTQDALDH